MAKAQDKKPPATKRKRGTRRVTVAGTGNASADGPEPRIETVEPATKKTTDNELSERDRWLLEQKPPHY